MKFIVCVNWGDKVKESTKRECTFCEQTLALTSENAARVDEMDLFPMCCSCSLEMIRDQDVQFGGYVLEGQLMPVAGRRAAIVN